MKLASEYASVGVLIYTASFAVLEAGVWTSMVLAWRTIEYLKKKRLEEGKALGLELGLTLGLELGAEAHRRSQATGQPFEEVLEELKKTGWKPGKTESP